MKSLNYSPTLQSHCPLPCCFMSPFHLSAGDLKRALTKCLSAARVSVNAGNKKLQLGHPLRGAVSPMCSKCDILPLQFTSFSWAGVTSRWGSLQALIWKLDMATQHSSALCVSCFKCIWGTRTRRLPKRFHQTRTVSCYSLSCQSKNNLQNICRYSWVGEVPNIDYYGNIGKELWQK